MIKSCVFWKCEIVSVFAFLLFLKNFEKQHVKGLNDFFQFFKIDISLGDDYLKEIDFIRQFERVEKAAYDSSRKSIEPVGILTTTNRTEWAKARETLMEGDWHFFVFEACHHDLHYLCCEWNVHAFLCSVSIYSFMF